MNTNLTGVLEDMDYHIIQAEYEEDVTASACVGMWGLPDEVLLAILRHVPTCDLLLKVAHVCRKLYALCHDKTLLSHICLSEEYTASDLSVRQTLKQLAGHVQSLSLSGCYWLSGSTMEHLVRCRTVTHLDLSGCRLTSLRLSHLLSTLSLKSLAFDVAPGFSSAQLSSEAVDSLGRLSELRQTLLTPSYGVVPYCAQLRRLALQFDIPDVTREGARVCCQLMVDQNTVPHYQQLQEFSATLAPGEVNQILLLLYLAVFSVRVPERLQVFLVSVPGPNPAHWGGVPTSFHTNIETLQLPRSWLDSRSLQRALQGSALKHLGFNHCPALRAEVLQSLIEGGIKDATQLISLNLSGLSDVPYPECSAVRGEDELIADTMSRLVTSCPNLRHLNLTHTHYHHDNNTPGHSGETHLCASLSKLGHLRSLALPACALSDGSDAHVAPANTTSLFGLKKAPCVGLPTYRPDSEPSSPAGDGTSGLAPLLTGCPSLEALELTDGTSGLAPLLTGCPSLEALELTDGTSGLARLLTGCPSLETLELTGPGFISALPRLEACKRACLKPRGVCAWTRGVGDAHVAALEALPRLRRLTLAGLPGVLKGTGLARVAERCKDLQALSLANLGSLKAMTYAPALLDTLRHCTQLQELRLEQPYLRANGPFFQALSCCSRLRRVCLISRSGIFDPVAVETFMERCHDVVMCHMFMGGNLVACRTLQKTLLDRYSAERPALSVVIYPLQHEDLPLVIRVMPLPLLDQITLFHSHVAQATPSPPW